ncbi:MAG: hypothetical protein QOF02_3512 [Blastocatellia bacterium]|jgi:hypothetical protein|nr:hypothetical protein [Blastocatellia bacterium]
MKNIEDFFPLTPTQQGVLFQSLFTPNTRVYFQQLSSTFRGRLDAEQFARAWQRVVNRHPALRTSFVWDGVKEPVQVVHKQVQSPFETHDWRALDEHEQQQRLEEFLRADRERGVDFAKAPVMRLALFQLSDELHEFVWSYHHIIMDGWSVALVRAEVLNFYAAFCEGRDLELDSPRPFRDYVVWLRKQDLSKAEAFWRETLAGFRRATPLNVEREVKSLPDREEGYDEQQILIRQATTSALQSLAQQNQLTFNTLIQGAWALLLSRYSGEPDLIFGVVFAGRPPAIQGVESMVGVFVNTLPMRVQLPPRTPLIPWLKKLQTQQVLMQQYEHSPLVQIQSWSEAPRGELLFESIFAFENFLMDSTAMEGFLEAVKIRAFERTHYPLTAMIGLGAEMSVRILYDDRSIAAPAITRMLGHFAALLEDIVAHPGKDISDLSHITEAESQQLTDDFNASLEVY